MNYRFHRAALGEHLDEVAFHESRLPGLGTDHLAEFEKVMARICAMPDFYPQVGHSDLRKAGLKRFPFHVVYQVKSGIREQPPPAPDPLLYENAPVFNEQEHFP